MKWLVSPKLLVSLCTSQLAALRHEVEIRMHKSVKDGQTVSPEVKIGLVYHAIDTY